MPCRDKFNGDCGKRRQCPSGNLLVVRLYLGFQGKLCKMVWENLLSIVWCIFVASAAGRQIFTDSNSLPFLWLDHSVKQSNNLIVLISSR